MNNPISMYNLIPVPKRVMLLSSMLHYKNVSSTEDVKFQDDLAAVRRPDHASFSRVYYIVYTFHETYQVSIFISHWA